MKIYRYKVVLMDESTNLAVLHVDVEEGTAKAFVRGIIKNELRIVRIQRVGIISPLTGNLVESFEEEYEKLQESHKQLKYEKLVKEYNSLKAELERMEKEKEKEDDD